VHQLGHRSSVSSGIESERASVHACQIPLGPSIGSDQGQDYRSSSILEGLSVMQHAMDDMPLVLKLVARVKAREAMLWQNSPSPLSC
jgi:hypothetical protein